MDVDLGMDTSQPRVFEILATVPGTHVFLSLLEKAE